MQRCSTWSRDMMLIQYNKRSRVTTSLMEAGGVLGGRHVDSHLCLKLRTLAQELYPGTGRIIL